MLLVSWWAWLCQFDIIALPNTVNTSVISLKDELSWEAQKEAILEFDVNQTDPKIIYLFGKIDFVAII